MVQLRLVLVLVLYSLIDVTSFVVAIFNVIAEVVSDVVVPSCDNNNDYSTTNAEYNYDSVDDAAAATISTTAVQSTPTLMNDDRSFNYSYEQRLNEESPITTGSTTDNDIHRHNGIATLINEVQEIDHVNTIDHNNTLLSGENHINYSNKSHSVEMDDSIDDNNDCIIHHSVSKKQQYDIDNTTTTTVSNRQHQQHQINVTTTTTATPIILNEEEENNDNDILMQELEKLNIQTTHLLTRNDKGNINSTANTHRRNNNDTHSRHTTGGRARYKPTSTSTYYSSSSFYEHQKDLEIIDERSLLDIFGEVAKEYFTQRVIPPTDIECRWDWRSLQCESYCYCSLQWQLGDYHLGRACRYRQHQHRQAHGSITTSCVPTVYIIDQPIPKRFLSLVKQTLDIVHDQIYHLVEILILRVHSRYRIIQNHICFDLWSHIYKNPVDDNNRCWVFYPTTTTVLEKVVCDVHHLQQTIPLCRRK